MYAKVFKSLWDGSLAETWQGWAVFVFMLAHADQDGTVDMTPLAIARRSGLPPVDVERALKILTEPDPNSRSKECEGRRLILIDPGRPWGWSIVNYRHYRSLKDAETIRIQTRERVNRHRNAMKPSVTLGNAPKRQAEAEAEAEVDRTNPCPVSPDGMDWRGFFEEHVWPNRPRKGAPGDAAAESKKLALARWLKIRPQTQQNADRIADALEADVASLRALGKEGDKCPHLSTWINQARWESMTP